MPCSNDHSADGERKGQIKEQDPENPSFKSKKGGYGRMTHGSERLLV
ncbi:hypothetical protein SynMITS9220_01356 [Synechococcus sp. MIT S9220]|nr:hypothetical protein SynMITS9220_01356 [Synechococcus sp. MIT S9220]